ncbi:S-adenosylmethionine:tRNA ribosyltransferase-isomerase, partial [Acinetobacter baumannii]
RMRADRPCVVVLAQRSQFVAQRQQAARFETDDRHAARGQGREGGDEPVEILLERAGRMPLPPYIAGTRATDEADKAEDQTMFAARDGAGAA